MKSFGTVRVTSPNDREILITRSFAAPRAIVWETMTRPELLMRWLTGPPGWSMTRCENNLAVGSAFHWSWRGPQGQEMDLHGVNFLLTPLECIRRSELCKFGGVDAKQVATLRLAEEDSPKGPATTLLSLRLEFATKAARDATLTGCEARMSEAYVKLEEMLASGGTGCSAAQAA